MYDTGGTNITFVFFIFTQLLTTSSTSSLEVTYKFKSYFSEEKFSRIENLKIKSLTCFKFQIKITVVLWFCVFCELSINKIQCFLTKPDRSVRGGF